MSEYKLNSAEIEHDGTPVIRFSHFGMQHTVMFSITRNGWSEVDNRRGSVYTNSPLHTWLNEQISNASKVAISDIRIHERRTSAYELRIHVWFLSNGHTYQVIVGKGRFGQSAACEYPSAKIIEALKKTWVGRLLSYE